jgi:hypothetical protein
MFVWAKMLFGCSFNQTASILKKGAGIIGTAGIGPGSQGEEYITFSLTVSDEKIKKVVGRIEQLSIGGKKR